MFKSIFLLNLFLTLINFGFPNDSSEGNQTNELSPFEHNSSESKFPQNKIIHRINISESSNPCGRLKNAQFGLLDNVEQKRTPLFRWKIRKPHENSNINVTNVNLNNHNIVEINSEKSSKTVRFKTGPHTSIFKYGGNNTLQNLQYDNLQIPVVKSYTSSDTVNNITATLFETDLTLLPILSKINKNEKVNFLDKVNKTDINTEDLDSQTEYEKYETNIKSGKDNQVDSITGEDNIENVGSDTYFTQGSAQEDVSLSSDSTEFNRAYDSKNMNREDQRRSNNFVYSDKQSDSNESELEESELIDYTNFNLNDINLQPLQSKAGMMLPELDDTNPLLIESFRICYACSSASDVSCLKPNRQTTVKYCHKDNRACVVKSFRFGSSKYLIRDCASSCKHSDIFGVTVKYESCSICHSNLCNSAYSVSVSIIPFLLLFVAISNFY